MYVKLIDMEANAAFSECTVVMQCQAEIGEVLPSLEEE